ncbi:hypothetical protein PMIN06_004405 [Paraphaeosphaeria minitans]|uniref:Uncharacterized protein n=1 Tax=Paraphaeosphaeria minitans TaxID=565426 RepID=A0A9P6GKM6_9PLEO|nr:hypothetical protein PMIN01_04622 [Paraphaeosphaeria minitans]
MPISPSAQRDVYRTREAVRQIQIHHAMHPTRATDIHTDELVDFNCPHAPRIFNWLSAMPSDPSKLVESEASPEKTAELYKDYLNWCSSILRCLKKELDLHEMEYRRLGLKYHQTPLYLRDPTATPANPRPRGLSPSDPRMSSAAPAALPINPAILHALHSIFSPDQPRTTDQFFSNWRTVQKAFVDIRVTLDIDYNQFERHQLKSLLCSVEHDVDFASNLLTEIETQLEGLAQNLGEVMAQRRMCEGANLNDASDIERSAFKAWLGTFPEVVSGEVNVDIVEMVMRTAGAELSMDFNNNYSSWDKDEERTQLGLLWEAERGL